MSEFLLAKVTAEVIGFATWGELEPFGGSYYPTYAREFSLLHPISELLDMIPDALPLAEGKKR